MNAGAALADRNLAVRTAARAWRAAGLVSADLVAEVDARFPDDRSRPGTALRVLLFAFTLLAGCAALALFAGLLRGWFGMTAFGVGFAVLTEVQVHRLRRCGGGTEEATSLLAVGLVTGGVSWAGYTLLGFPAEWSDDVALLCIVGAAAGAAWCWGMPAYGALAAVGAVLAAAEAPPARATWCAVAALALLASESGRRSRSLAPAQREAAAWAGAVAAGALYVAVNLASFDHAFIEHLRIRPTASLPDPMWRPLAIVLTALLPLAVLGVAVRRRDRLGLWLGAVMLAASAVTLRHYVHLAPLWVVLVVAGTIVGGLALALQRWLAAGRGHERWGFTAAPLGAGRGEQAAEIVAVLAALAPAPRPLPGEPASEGGTPRLEPGGGSFGGGGASDSF